MTQQSPTYIASEKANGAFGSIAGKGQVSILAP
jgi:hypothetical protein